MPVLVFDVVISTSFRLTFVPARICQPSPLLRRLFTCTYSTTFEAFTLLQYILEIEKELLKISFVPTQPACTFNYKTAPPLLPS